MKLRLALFASFLLTACSVPRFEATPSYGFSKLSGDFAIATGSISSTNDVKDIGLGDREGAPGARVDLQWGSPHLSVEVVQTNSEGSGTTTADLTQGSTTISAGTDVDSKVDLTYGNAIVTFDFVPSDAVEVGLGFGLEAASVQTKVKPTGLGAGIDTDESAPVPVVALRAGVDLGPISVDGLLSGIQIDYGGDSLTFYDLDLRARWEMYDHAHLLVGYRYWKVDLDYEDGADNVKLDVTSSGPYFGLVIAF